MGAWRRLGVRSRLVIFPDENHWVLNPGNRYERARVPWTCMADDDGVFAAASLKWHHEVFKWFDEFVGDKAKKET